MTKLLVIPSNLDIKKINANAFLFGIKDMSVNMPNYYGIDELLNISSYLKENNKEVFVSLNKNMHNKDLEMLEEILIKLSKLDVAGIFYYDVAVLNLVKKLNLSISLIWSAEHLTTNYTTINFWKNYGVNGVNISAEITKDEIIEIRENTNVLMFVNVLGYLPMFVSERHLLTNYLERFNLKKEMKMGFLEKSGSYFPIVNNYLGTNIYSANFLNAYLEYLEFIKHNIDYVILNSFLIPDDKFAKIVEVFNSKDSNGEEQINKVLDYKTDKGFLYKETIYKVKK